MDKLSIPKKSNKPSILLMSIALAISFSLPYYLVKNFSHHKKVTTTAQNPILTPVTNDTSKHEPQKIVIIDVKKVEEVSPAKPNQVKPRDNQWQIITARAGDSMAAIFNRLGLSAKNLQAIIHNNPHTKILSKIKPNQQLQFLINKGQLDKLIIPVNNIQILTIYRLGSAYKTKIDYKEMRIQNNYVTATLRGSFVDTAHRLNIPNKLINQMRTIFKRKIDFAHASKTGDQFSMIYEAFYADNKYVATGDILAVTYTNRRKSFKAIRHTNSKGEHDYYTPKGNSLKKAFSRYPIRFSHISSTFSLSRLHPILHYRRAHKGIDLAASIGTPIHAIGDGVITVIGRHNGYGNMIKIQHDKTYSSIYAHMLRFQKGFSKGSVVKRNQIIGYVGQTGLASGPHCHYELHVNNEPRNPTTYPLPTAASIPAKELASFKTQANVLLARLKNYEESTIALANRNKKIDVG